MTNLSMPRCDIDELKGQIEQLKALNTADDYLIKLLEEQNQQLKELLKECRQSFMGIRAQIEEYEYSMARKNAQIAIDEIDNAIGEKK